MTEKNELEALTKPGEEIQIDFSGNLPEYGSIYLFIWIDRFIKWPMAGKFKKTGGENVIKFVRKSYYHKRSTENYKM